VKPTCTKAKMTKWCGVFLIMLIVSAFSSQNGFAAVQAASIENASNVTEFDKITMVILEGGNISQKIERITGKSGAKSLTDLRDGSYALVYDDGSLVYYNITTGTPSPDIPGLSSGTNRIAVINRIDEKYRIVFAKLTPTGVGEVAGYVDVDVQVEVPVSEVIPRIYLPGVHYPAGINMTDLRATFGDNLAVLVGKLGGEAVLVKLPVPIPLEEDYEPTVITFDEADVEEIYHVAYLQDDQNPSITRVYLNYSGPDGTRLGYFDTSFEMSVPDQSVTYSIPIDGVVTDMDIDPVEGELYVLHTGGGVSVYDGELASTGTSFVFDVSPGYALNGQLTVGPVVPELPQNGLVYLTFILGALIIALRRSSK